jgi:hypothetical protein
MPTPEIALVQAVCDEAFLIVEAAASPISPISPTEALEIRSQMALRVMAAVADGERNLEELKIIALNLRLALILAFLSLPSPEFLLANFEL